MTTYRRSHRRLVRSDPRQDPHFDPDGWIVCLLAIAAPWIVAFLAYLYALALQS